MMTNKIQLLVERRSNPCDSGRSNSKDGRGTKYPASKFRHSVYLPLMKLVLSRVYSTK